ncbi:hypothetical protein [Bacillus sp. FJAT-27445]|uniref:hypothetical protein n=1 Tax=Bacillus sp. FJAT-27445 TaxID=1679166 RepID=UPI0007444CB1|nr:hypothetical protein [Bacillus sp. FJAT-27445]
MDLFKEYISYLPLAVAIIAASLGYITGQRSSKINRFFQQVDINLKEVCGPMHFHLKRIIEEEDSEKREKLLDFFYESYSTLNPNLYKLGNKFIIDWIIKNQFLYSQFKKKRGLNEWEEFWKHLFSLNIMVKHEYWKNFDSLYGEYRWFQRTLTSNTFIRLWHELIHLIYQALQFTVLISIFFVLYSIYDNFFVHKLPEGSIPFALTTFLVAVTVYCFVIIISVDIYGLKNQRESLLRKLAQHYAPGVLNYWDEKIIHSGPKGEVPPMYIQRKKSK